MHGPCAIIAQLIGGDGESSLRRGSHQQFSFPHTHSSHSCMLKHGYDYVEVQNWLHWARRVNRLQVMQGATASPVVLPWRPVAGSAVGTKGVYSTPQRLCRRVNLADVQMPPISREQIFSLSEADADFWLFYYCLPRGRVLGDKHMTLWRALSPSEAWVQTYYQFNS